MTQPIPNYLFLAWSNMFRRCYYVNDPAYHHYGGRGIVVAARWRDLFVFCDDVGERPTPKHSLDRIDNDGPYGPKNCKWSTQAEQMMNTRSTRHWLTFNGERLSIRQWSERTGINIHTMRMRVRRGWPVEMILTKQEARPGLRVTQRNASALCKAAGVPIWTFYYRLSKGLSEEEALRP